MARSLISSLGLAALSYFLLLDHGALAFPSGAGSCGPGLAVSGPHLANPTLSTLAAADIQVEVGGQTLSEDSGGLELTAGTHDVVVTANSGVFRGVLIRAARDDGSELIDLVPTTDLLTPAAVCSAPVAGITHMSREDKTQVSGSLTVDDAAGPVSLQVTVVFFASGAGPSSHAFGEMLLQFGEDPPLVEANPTDMPVDPPTDAPVPVPTDIPVNPPPPPVAAPTDMPVNPPPVVAPTDMPVDPPTDMPVNPPPVVAPTDMPVAAPVAVVERCRIRARRAL